MSFSDEGRADTGQEHQWVIEAFKNLIIQKNELGDIGKLVNLNPILTDLKGKEKAYDNRHAGILAFNTPQIIPRRDEDLPKPLFLTVKNKDGGNIDDIVYGTNKKDTIVLDVFDDVGINSQGSLRYNIGLGNDIIYGKAEDDLLFGGSGNDTIRGDQGNDSINGQNDNDILFSDADDDIIWGGKEDDTLIGGQGKDTLTGGDGSDIFVFSPGDGAASREEADIITDFGTGFLVGGGADKIGLAGGLNSNIVEVVSEGGFGPFGGQTVLKANGEFLAIINGKFTKSDLNFIDNFKIV
jgi:RTX calcium-binding nonapeptide repeat (4 copies)